MPTHDARLPAVPVSVAGKYRIVERLGTGGMGEVWKGWDPELRRWAAVKFLIGGDAEEIARFRREAQLAARLTHPNIAAVYDVGEAGGRPFLAMQLLDGFTLKERIGGDVREAVAWVREAALAVEFAHGQGVVHRDLKPDNLMVSGGRVFVMDFGLARSVEGRLDVSMPGTVVGTPTYMSPEQARGEKVGPRSDVWSLGATLYHLAAGRRPFEGRGVLDVLRSVREDDPPPPRRAGAVDADLEAVILRCLEKDPNLRYESASALAEDLTRWLDGDPVRGSRPSPVRRAGRWLRRHRVPALALVAGLSAAGAFAAAIVPPWFQARRTADLESARRREIELYLPIEKDLDVLRMKFYQPRFELTDREFAEYRALEGRLRGQMTRSGETAMGWYLIGRCREVPGDAVGAEEAYARSLSCTPGFRRSLIRRGRLVLEELLIQNLLMYTAVPDRSELKRRARRAVGWIQEAIRSGGADIETDYATRLLDLLEERPFECGAELERWRREPLVEEFLLLEGISCLYREDVSGFHGRIDQCIARVPSWHLPYYWRAVQRRTSELDEALADTRRARRIHPRYLPAVLLESIFLLARRDLAGAEPGVRQYVRERPGDSLGWMHLAVFETKAGRLEPAERAADRAVDLSEGSPDTLSSRAEIRIQRKDHAGAWDDVRAALAHAPGHPYALMFKSILLERDRLFDDARQALAQALKTDPDFPDAHFRMGRLLALSGDWDEAIRHYTRCLELAPHYVEARANRGSARRNRGDLAGALEDFDAALRLDPDHLPIRLNRASLKRDLGDLEGAGRDLDAVLSHPSPPPEAFVNRGYLRLKLGNRPGALEDFRRALEIAPPDWPGRADIERLLESR